MTNPTPDQDVAAVLAADTANRPRMRRWILIAAAVIAVLVLFLIVRGRGGRNDVQYVTQEVRRGNLSVRVSATGNLQPRRQVDIGSELSGTVVSVYVDVNDRVQSGQVLAQLDTARLRDEVQRGEASLRSAEARVVQTAATVEETRKELARLRDAHTRSEGRVVAPVDLESAEAAYERAVGDDRSTRAGVEEARASLQSARTNVGKATIRSPINGVVLARQVEPGQTVAASLQVATLFTIAEDLSQMEAEVSIDEADVSSVTEGQSAVFTVDAYPGRSYNGTVTRVNLGSTEEAGVVSYPATITVQNSDLSLRPGMTAAADIITTARNSVLLVPNAALQFTPETAEGTAPDGSAPEARGGGIVGVLLPRPPSTGGARGGANGANTPADAPSTAGSTQRVWVLQDGKPAPVPVTTGATNGQMTEVTGGALREGMQVITEAVTPAAGGAPEGAS